MKDSGVRAGGRSLTVLVYEYVTGGGLAGRELPNSWATEGASMHRAVVEDFASVPGVRVVTTRDARIPYDAPPGVSVRVLPDRKGTTIESLAAEVDYTVLIAPETDGILKDLTHSVKLAGGRPIGSSRRAVRLAGDKVRLSHHFLGNEVPTPRTLMLGPRSTDLLTHWEGPIVIKPRWGAGSVETILVREPRCPDWVNRDWSFVAQPYHLGKPMSASFLIDIHGNSNLLAIGRQRIEIDDDGRISYRGGQIPSGPEECPSAVSQAINSVLAFPPTRGLRGFVGVDFLMDKRGHAVILEINPRPTTSYVGLTRLYPPGTIAGAWLAGSRGSLKGTDWPDRLRLPRETKPISFEVDGTITPARLSR